MYGNTKDPEQPKQSWKGKMQQEESDSLTSNYTEPTVIKLYGTSTKTDRSMELDRKPRNKPTHLWSMNLWQRRQEYKLEKKINSSITGAGKTGQLQVKECN